MNVAPNCLTTKLVEEKQQTAGYEVCHPPTELALYIRQEERLTPLISFLDERQQVQRLNIRQRKLPHGLNNITLWTCRQERPVVMNNLANGVPRVLLLTVCQRDIL